ncbi:MULTISPECIES: hypothetical protein [Mammaliicoccus]|nr:MULTISPECIES: hypothetical protein [Mammaliicoccus]WQK89122.1 hypothetical protein P3U62_06385 [Mammaliicoccus vitulinus]GGH97703.1 hypothetical protein GCM10007366_01250 [Mammaliicoccus vitulinus]
MKKNNHNDESQNNESKKYRTLAVLLTFVIVWGLVYWLFIV